MSEFSVVTSQLQAMHGRLGTISSDLAELCGQVGTHASAAAQTPIDGALSEVMGQWAVHLPNFGHASDSLQAVLSGGAAAYAAADGDVARASNP